MERRRVEGGGGCEGRGVEGMEGERKVGERFIRGKIERGQCKLLSAVQNLRMQSWLVVEKFSFNCLLISISGNGTWTELEEGWRDGKKTSFWFFL